MTLKNLNYPLDFKFKISTLSSDFNITDANGNYVCYVRQKLFKLKEKVVVFSDESRREELYHIACASLYFHGSRLHNSASQLFKSKLFGSSLAILKRQLFIFIFSDLNKYIPRK